MKIITIAILQCLSLLWGIHSSHADGKTLYEQKCLACHGKDGKGNQVMATPLKVDPASLDMTKPETKKKSDAALLEIINDGQGKMQGYAKSLSPEQQKAVLEYVRTLN